MNVLGIHFGHDSSAALIRDGEIVADVAEERFTRIKHYAGFPVHSIQACLDMAGLSMTEIDVVAVSSQHVFDEFNHFLALQGSRRERERLAKRAARIMRTLAGKSWEKPPLYMKTFPLRPSAEIVHVEHHMAHAAAAYYTCGSDERQLIVTMDGVGDGTSVAIWRGEAGRITLLKRYGTEASLGWFYGNVTEALGWWHGDGEGKTMGLAPYGQPEKVRGCLDRFYPKFDGGQLVEPHRFGTPYYWNYNGAYHWHFDEADEIHCLVQRYGREHVAAEAQRVLEEQVAAVIYPWLEREGTRNLCCGGGVFLNVKLNQRIWESGKVSFQHIFPNAGDAGLAVGAALYAYHRANPGRIGSITHLYWGPQFDNDEILSILRGRGLAYRFVEDVASTTANLLAQNKIVGWFQGRMESGPRALGGRSILMSPLHAENKDIINARVKFREAFRPFCPSLLAESINDYVLHPRQEYFMITSFQVREEKVRAIPAVVHVDGTMRPQTVEQNVNPLYWDLIRAFGELTGEPVVLNTSFNIMNEPIICHPREAIRCFYDTGLDYLVLGNFIIGK